MSKTILITGASRGLGLATTSCLLSSGVHVIAVVRSETALNDVKSQYPHTLTVITGDVREESTTLAAVKAIGSTGLHGVIYNAGVLDPVTKLEHADGSNWRQLFDINLFSIVDSLPHFLPLLRKTKGRIVMISSGAATGSYQGWSAYGCSKAAMNHLAQDLACEEADVTTIALRPGVVDTGMQQAIREQHGSVMTSENHQKFTAMKNDGGLLDPNVVGKVIAKLALHAEAELSGKFIQWSDFADKYED